jgi:hypothetical protein
MWIYISTPPYAFKGQLYEEHITASWRHKTCHAGFINHTDVHSGREGSSSFT